MRHIPVDFKSKENFSFVERSFGENVQTQKKKKRLKETSIFGGISNGIIWGVEFPSAALDSKKAENYNM